MAGRSPGARLRARRARGGHGGGRPVSEINITPMVDVMLVLLIIFVVAAPLLVTGVTVDLPQTSARALPSDEQPITITLDRDGQRYIDKEMLPPEAFSARLSALFGERGAETRVMIRADDGIAYGSVAALLADVTGAGFRKVALVNQPKGAPEE